MELHPFDLFYLFIRVNSIVIDMCMISQSLHLMLVVRTKSLRYSSKVLAVRPSRGQRMVLLYSDHQ